VTLHLLLSSGYCIFMPPGRALEIYELLMANILSGDSGSGSGGCGGQKGGGGGCHALGGGGGGRGRVQHDTDRSAVGLFAMDAPTDACDDDPGTHLYIPRLPHLYTTTASTEGLLHSSIARSPL
jgi:hypothetical protein